LNTSSIFSQLKSVPDLWFIFIRSTVTLLRMAHYMAGVGLISSVFEVTIHLRAITSIIWVIMHVLFICF